jgi:hypothetical protein
LAFQTFYQILVKLLKTTFTSSSPSFHQNTSYQNPSLDLTPKISMLFYFLLFFLILAPFFTFFPQDLSVTFLPQDLCPFPPHQAINERKQATDFLGTGPARTGYKVGFGRMRTRSSSTPTTQSTRTDADNATSDRAVDDEDPNLKNPNFIDEIGEKQPNFTPNFPFQS